MTGIWLARGYAARLRPVVRGAGLAQRRRRIPRGKRLAGAGGHLRQGYGERILFFVIFVIFVPLMPGLKPRPT